MKSKIYVAYVYERPDMKENPKGMKWINIHVLTACYSRTWKEYRKLHKDAVALFPFLKDVEGECGIVTESGSMKGFPMLSYGCYVPIDQVFPVGNNCYHFDVMKLTYQYL